MVNKVYNINLDLRRVTAQAESIPPVVEGDNGNIFVITLTNDGTPVDLSGCKVLCVFSKTDGSTVEQDTEDANVSLDDYGISVTGTPAANDTVTITASGGACSAAVSGSITAATVDAATFLTMFPDDGTYVFTYSGTSWVYGSHSVVIGGVNNNIITVGLKTASFGVGKNNCELQVYSGSDLSTLITTAQFNFDGRKGIINEETIQSEDKYPILVSLIAEAASALGLALPFTNPSVTANTLSPTDPATASVSVGSDSVAWTFGIPQGITGNGISSITLTSGSHTAGTYDTYRVTYTDGTYLDLQIWNGSNGTNGTNGVGIASITISGNHDPGTFDTMTIALDDGTVYTTGIYNGADGAKNPSNVAALALGTASAGTEDTYSRSDHVHPMPSASNIPTNAVGVSVQNSLDSKAKVANYTASITTSWTGGSAPYTQVISVTGMLATDSPVVDIVPSDTYATAEQELEAWGSIYRIVAGAGQITVYATEQTSIAIPIQIMVVR